MTISRKKIFIFFLFFKITWGNHNFILGEFVSDGEDEAFSDIQISVEDTPEVIAARKEEARKQEAKEKLKKSN